MSIKDKITIALIIVFVLLFGCTITGMSYDISGTLDDLAWVAANNPQGFIDTNIDSWYNKTISVGSSNTIYYKTGICMYHTQSTTETTRIL